VGRDGSPAEGGAVSGPWIVVIVVGVATIALKGAGPVLLGGRELPPRALGVVELLAPTLLAALIVTNAFADGRHLVLDARAAGLGAAALALLARIPLLAVIVIAAAVAALVRALG
jgi:branched-subunit amino acid transport protein